jgi:hypothetical protein
VRYVDYIGNLARLAVDLANTGSPASLGPLGLSLLDDHLVGRPDETQLGALLPALRAAVGAAADGGPLDPVDALLERYPPDIHVSDHDGEGRPHLHFARNGEDPVTWIGRSCAAALAHIICGDPAVNLGRCGAAGCARFYVDASRNGSRRFCSHACASRTTVAAFRARRRTAGRA